jgi:hypothetical protein
MDTCSCLCEPWAARPQSLWRSRRTCDFEPWQPVLRELPAKAFPYACMSSRMAEPGVNPKTFGL